MKKLAIIANCQAPVIAGALASHENADVTLYLDVNWAGQDIYRKAKSGIADAISRHDTWIISQRLDDYFGDISTRQLQSVSEMYRTTTNVYFSGLHPDITYLGRFQQRIRGFFGDYHSRIILVSFVQGLSVRDCVQRFKQDIYARAGYFAEFENSSRELIRRDESLDIKFATQFIEMLKFEPCLLTINHPTMNVVAAQARAIADSLELPGKLFPNQYYPNELGNGIWWPIYPEIAEKNRLAYRTPMIWKGGPSLKQKFFSIEEFVNANYSAYREIGTKVLKEADQYAGIAQQFNFLN